MYEGSGDAAPPSPEAAGQGVAPLQAPAPAPPAPISSHRPAFRSEPHPVPSASAIILRMELLPRRRPRYGLRHGLVMSRPAALATSPSCPAVLATSPDSAAEGRADSFLSLETPLLGGWGNTWNQRADMQGPRRCRSHPLAQQRRQQRPGCAAPAVLRVLRPHGVRPHARRRVSCGAGAAVQQVPPLLGAPVLLPAALLRPPPVCSLN